MSSSEDDRSGDEREDEAEYEVQAIIGYRESDTDGDEESSKKLNDTVFIC